jgi:hypothetical protein
MSTRTFLRRGATLACVLAVLGVASSTVAEAEWGSDNRGNFEAASAAIPAQPGDTSDDLSSHVVRMAGRSVRASAVATSSATCDGCTGNAVTVQVIYARKVSTLAIDNVAAAWASCSACQGSALSLQVVIARKVGIVRANNRSLAVNANCMGCRTAAAAVQIVAISPSNRELSQAALGQINALRDQLLAQLKAQVTPTGRKAFMFGRAAPVTPAAQTALTATTKRIQSIVTADLGATSASQDVKVQTG